MKTSQSGLKKQTQAGLKKPDEKNCKMISTLTVILSQLNSEGLHLVETFSLKNKKFPDNLAGKLIQ